jgi:proteasome accessory factor A
LAALVPELLSARDHVAATHAMLCLACSALRTANARLPEGVKIVVLANNSDGQGHSYGSHISFLMKRRAWIDLFERRLHNLLFLASYQSSSILFTSQGKIGAENNRAPVDYQISQRADFFQVIQGSQTKFNRPIVNSRDEALCGSWRLPQEQPSLSTFARLHVIFYDQTLCHTASFLKVGVMQIILAMIEAGCVNSELILEDAVEAVWRWSHDPSLQTRAALVSGRRLTAVELQLEFFEAACRFVESGGCDGIVPEAQMILDLWGDTLQKLAARDFAALSRRLDWVLKLQILERILAQRPEFNWNSPQLKHLDFMYASLEDGLYWACEREGAVDKIVTDEHVESLRTAPPENTRAWTRAQLLQLARPEQVERMDWDSITFSLRRQPSSWPYEITVNLANPLKFTKAECACVFDRSANLEDALELLGAVAEPAAVNILQTTNYAT